MLPEEYNNDLMHKNLFSLLAVFILLITITGVSVAAYTWNYTSTHANTIGTGNISMSLLESDDEIKLKSLLPMDDLEGVSINKKNSYDFAVTTSATGSSGNINYKILLKKLAPKVGYSSFDDSNIKIYITQFDQSGETEVLPPTSVSDVLLGKDKAEIKFKDDQKSFLIHSHTSNKDTKTTKYRLRMWIDKNSFNSRLDSNTKYDYKLKLDVTGDLIQ